MFRWSGANYVFQTATHNAISLGGGAHFALWLDGELHWGAHTAAQASRTARSTQPPSRSLRGEGAAHNSPPASPGAPWGAGSSGACETFNCPCLASSADFKVAQVELWAFGVEHAGAVARGVSGARGEENAPNPQPRLPLVAACVSGVLLRCAVGSRRNSAPRGGLLWDGPPQTVTWGTRRARSTARRRRRRLAAGRRHWALWGPAGSSWRATSGGAGAVQGRTTGALRAGEGRSHRDCKEIPYDASSC